MRGEGTTRIDKSILIANASRGQFINKGRGLSVIAINTQVIGATGIQRDKQHIWQIIFATTQKENDRQTKKIKTFNHPISFFV